MFVSGLVSGPVVNVFDSGRVSGPGLIVKKKNVCFWPSEWACSECV